MEKETALAWLMCLDRAAQIGALYQAPGMLVLKDVVWSNDNHVSFSSEPFTGDEWYYKFDGYVQEGNLAGRLSKFSKRTNSLVSQNDLLPITHTESRHNLRRYSNAKYVPDAGDLVGAELILVGEQQEDIQGLLTCFDGCWGYTGTHLVLGKAKRSQPDLFGLSTPTIGGRQLGLKLSHKTATLRPRQSNPEDIPGQILFERKSEPVPNILDTKEEH